MTDKQKIKNALEIIVQYGGNDGAHHKTWVLDQAVRALAGGESTSKMGGFTKTAEYEQIVKDAKSGENGPDTYGYDEGIAP